MSISGIEFDTLHLYARLNGSYTVPRGMIDNFKATSVPEPAAATAILCATGTFALLRVGRRRHQRAAR